MAKKYYDKLYKVSPLALINIGVALVERSADCCLPVVTRVGAC